MFARLLCDDGFADRLFGLGSKTQLDVIRAACVTGGQQVELARDAPCRGINQAVPSGAPLGLLAPSLADVPGGE